MVTNSLGVPSNGSFVRLFSIPLLSLSLNLPRKNGPLPISLLLYQIQISYIFIWFPFLSNSSPIPHHFPLISPTWVVSFSTFSRWFIQLCLSDCFLFYSWLNLLGGFCRLSSESSSPFLESGFQLWKSSALSGQILFLLCMVDLSSHFLCNILATLYWTCYTVVMLCSVKCKLFREEFSFVLWSFCIQVLQVFKVIKMSFMILNGVKTVSLQCKILLPFLVVLLVRNSAWGRF